MTVNPDLQDILDLLNSMDMPALDTVSPDDMRSLFALPMEGEAELVARVEERIIDGAEGAIKARVYWPEGSGPFPLLVFFHGGGFVLCDLDTHDGLCRALCNGSQSVVVSVDYRLAPEAPYPAAPEDCYAATLWCVAHAAELNADATRLAVGGDSAGGCLAAVVAQMARDRKGPEIQHQLLLYPVTDRNFDRNSYLACAEGYFLTRDMMQWFWGHYLERDEHATEPYAAPLQAGNLSGLPAATVITAGFDPLRDEGAAYAEKLQAAGVSVNYRCFEDMIHGFLSLPIPFAGGEALVTSVAADLKTALNAG